MEVPKLSWKVVRWGCAVEEEGCDRGVCLYTCARHKNSVLCMCLQNMLQISTQHLATPFVGGKKVKIVYESYNV